MMTLLLRWRPVAVILMASAGLLAGVLLGANIFSSAHGSEQTLFRLCARQPEALDAVGSDLQVRATLYQDCRNTTPQVERPEFNPLYHWMTAPIDSVSSSVPFVVSVDVVVVPRSSRQYALAAAAGFIVDSRYSCEGDDCRPSGYEVYVTPEDLSTPLPDQLVAIAFGTPRDPCQPPTPTWIQVHAGCTGASR